MASKTASCLLRERQLGWLAWEATEAAVEAAVAA